MGNTIKGNSIEVNFIETERLILRPWEMSDAERLFELASDPDIGPMAGWPVHTSVANSKAILLTALIKPESYAICLKDRTLIGAIGIKTGKDTDLAENEKQCEIGFWVGKEYWGKGYTPEATKAIIKRCEEVLQMEKIWCAFYNGNTQSQRVQEKCGFTFHHEVKNYYASLVKEYKDMTVNVINCKYVH